MGELSGTPLSTRPSGEFLLKPSPCAGHLKSMIPAINVPHRHEAVATDMVYSDTPAVDSGVQQAQLFVGKESLVSDIYTCGLASNLPILWKTIFTGTVPWTSSSVIQPKMRSDKVKDILRAYNINDWQSEPYHQNHNPGEWQYRTIKTWVNTLMNRTGAPA